MAEYSVPNFNAVNFALEEYIVPSFNSVDYELGQTGNITNLPVSELTIQSYSIASSVDNNNVVNLTSVSLSMQSYEPTTYTGDFNVSNLPVVELSLEKYAISSVRTVDETRIKYNTTLGCFEFINRGVLIGRLCENGNLQISGIVEENVVF